jgi:hypothetical protein
MEFCPTCGRRNAGRPRGKKQDAITLITAELERELDQNHRVRLLGNLADLQITKYKRAMKPKAQMKERKAIRKERDRLRKPPAEEGSHVSIEELLEINPHHSRYGTPKPVVKTKETENLENFMDLLNQQDEIDRVE